MSKLAQVIQHHWREAVPDDRLAHLVKDASRGLGRALQMRLAQHGVSFGHWSFLRILWESEGLTQRELSELAGVMEPTTFAALKAMERMGYVTRRQNPGDRRRIFIDLTPLGRSLEVRFPRGWLTEHPLTRADLVQEVDFLKAAGFRLRVF